MTEHATAPGGADAVDDDDDTVQGVARRAEKERAVAEQRLADENAAAEHAATEAETEPATPPASGESKAPRKSAGA
jgi:hypothetical protein